MQFQSIYNQIFEQAGNPVIPDFPKFSSDLAYQIAQLNCSIKQRYSSSPGNIQALEDLADILTKQNIPCYIDKFVQKVEIGNVKFRNLNVDFTFDKNNPYIIIGAHHDTKYLPQFPGFTGANDGASGVGLLVGLIFYFHKLNAKLPFNLKFIFFDGQECFYEYNENDGLIGSKYAANKYKKICKYMILADMIGSKTFHIQFPKNSNQELIQYTKNIVTDLDYTQYFDFTSKSKIIDDTNPFEQYNIPTINFIDFQYEYWHTNYDTFDKLDKAGFEIVGNVIVQLIRQLCLV